MLLTMTLCDRCEPLSALEVWCQKNFGNWWIKGFYCFIVILFCFLLYKIRIPVRSLWPGPVFQ